MKSSLYRVVSMMLCFVMLFGILPFNAPVMPSGNAIAETVETTDATVETEADAPADPTEAPVTEAPEITAPPEPTAPPAEPTPTPEPESDPVSQQTEAPAATDTPSPTPVQPEYTSSDPSEQPTVTPAQTDTLAAYPYITFAAYLGGLKVVGCDPTVETAIVPGEVSGLAVLAIGEDAFLTCKNLTCVDVREGIQTIEEKAFHDCQELTQVILPESLRSIDPNAFVDCPKLALLQAPEESYADQFAKAWMAANPPETEESGINGDISTIDTTVADDMPTLPVASDNPDAAAIQTDMSPLAEMENLTGSVETEPVASIQLSGPSGMYAGQSATVIAFITSDSKIDQTIAWSLSDPTFATVKASGNRLTVTAAKTIPTASSLAVTATLSKIDSVLPVTATLYIQMAPKPSNVRVSADRESRLIDLDTPGDSIQLSAVVSPVEANSSVTWKSSNTAIAQVSATGLVTATGSKTGSVTITATTADGSNVPGTISLQVVRALTALSPSTTSYVLLGKTVTLKPIASPSNATNIAVNWSSSAKTIASVTSTGAVKGIGYGTAKITATSRENALIYTTWDITVKPATTKVTVTSHDTLGADSNTLDLTKGETTLFMSATAAPSGAHNVFNWASSNTKVAVVDRSSGVLTAVGNGTAMITATATDGTQKTGACAITVSTGITGLAVKGSPSVAIGKSVALSMSLVPANTTSTKVIWTSSDNGIASVDGKGTVKGIAAGTATITATSTANSAVQASFDMTVTPLTTGVVLNEAKCVIDLSAADTTVQLAATASPNETGDTFYWMSSRPAVATVDAQGLVTAMANGVAVITATAMDGSKANGTCNVTVNTSMTDLDISCPDSVVVGKSIPLFIAPTPANANQIKVNWSSSDEGIATTVKTGMLTGLKAGTVTITATDALNASVLNTKEITVTPLVKSIKILGDSVIDFSTSPMAKYTVVAGDDSARAVPVSWASSNTKIATITSDGKLTAKAVGSITLTAKALDGSGLTANLNITILVPVTGLSAKGGVTDFELGLAKRMTCVAVIEPSNATNRTVKWVTSNSKIATVTSVGLVTALREGTVTITATSQGNPSQQVAFTVTVKPAAAKVSIQAPRKIINLNTLSSLQLSAAVSPGTASQQVTWRSSNSKLAQVDSTGLVTAIAAGSVTITATSGDGYAKFGTVTLTIANAPSALTITGTDQVISLASATLGVFAEPNGASTAVTWASSNTAVATVSSKGMVTAKTVQEATKVTITAASAADPLIQAQTELTVLPLATQITITAQRYTLCYDAADPTLQLTAQCTPAVANQTVRWYSSDTQIATVSEQGLLTALKSGTVIITATAADGSNKTAHKAFRIGKKVTGITISGEDNLGAGCTMTLVATVAPEDALIPTVTWSSSDENVATVDANGLVTAQAISAKKTVIITAISKQNDTLKATATLIVTPAVYSMVISSTACTIDLSLAAKTLTLAVQITPADANQAVTWSSNNPTVISVDQSGVATGWKLGKATIKAVSVENPSMKAELLLEAVYTVQSVSIQATTTSLTSRQTVQLSALAQPAQASQRFTWASSDESAAMVDANGLVSAQAVSAKKTVIVTATSIQNVAKAVSVTLTVSPLTVTLSINPMTESLNLKAVGHTAQIRAVFMPVGATPNLLWSSDHPEIATVSVTGLVTGVAPGNARITAMAQDGSNLSAILDIAVVSTDFYYTPVQGGIQITQYVGGDTSLTIPQTIGGIPVVSIGDNTFTGNSILTSVSLPANLVAIGKEAFMSCGNLAFVSLPNTVSYIGEDAFSDCSKLAEMKPY